MRLLVKYDVWLKKSHVRHFSIIDFNFKLNKNSAEVDIAPAFGEITTACNVG